MSSRTINSDKANFPKYNRGSKMHQYDLFFDEEVGQARTGFYHSKFYDYKRDSSDTIWTVTIQYEGRTDLISAKFYGSAKYDWIIENANYIKDPIKDIRVGKQLIIPNKSKIYSAR